MKTSHKIGSGSILLFALIFSATAFYRCQNISNQTVTVVYDSTSVTKPAVITEATLNDTDDPAIWINPANPEASLIIGTDKGDSTGGL